MIKTMSGEALFHHWLLVAWCVLAVAAFAALLVIPAPYGRFARRGWGPGIGSRTAWLLMESPAALTVGLLFVLGVRRDPVSVLFALVWCAHYGYRGFVYPLRLRSSRRVPLFVVASAVAFNVTNGYLQGRHLFTLSAPRPAAWLHDPRLLAGATLFAIGLAITVRSDTLLRRLRAAPAQDYQIPRGGLFRRVSCPHYLGELVEWSAWALLTWSAPGLVFALWTAANLVPRALAHHRWYRSRFPDYPPERRAVIPFVL